MWLCQRRHGKTKYNKLSTLISINVDHTNSSASKSLRIEILTFNQILIWLMCTTSTHQFHCVSIVVYLKDIQQNVNLVLISQCWKVREWKSEWPSPKESTCFGRRVLAWYCYFTLLLWIHFSSWSQALLKREWLGDIESLMTTMSIN
jgi:hypothetical protein